MSCSPDLQIAAELIPSLPVPLDRLPYSPHFDIVHESFIIARGHECTKSETWQSLLGAGKRGMVGPIRRYPHAPSTLLAQADQRSITWYASEVIQAKGSWISLQHSLTA
jgi:hypothetical protein